MTRGPAAISDAEKETAHGRAGRRLAGALASRLSSDAFTLYLYGSAVLGDFRPGWSDLDILCLTAAPLSPDTAGRLVLLRQELAAENEPGFRLFEGGITSLAAFRDGRPALSVYWGTSGQRLADCYSIEPFSLLSLLDDGLLLHGEDIRPCLRPPTRMSCGMPSRPISVPSGPTASGPGGRYMEPDGCWTSPGALYPAHRPDPVQNRGRGMGPCGKDWLRDPSVLERVLAIRKEPLLYRDDPGTLDFIATLGPAVAAFAVVLETALSGSEQG